jgi:hypothetical protein
MSVNIEEHYCCLEIEGVCSKGELNEVLKDFAKKIWEKLQETGEYPEHFYSVEEEVPAGLDKALPVITAELWKYVSINDFNEGTASITIQYEYDSEKGDCELFENLCKFLFARSLALFFQIHSAAFDNSGSYSHQWVGYRKDGEIVLEYSDDYLKRVFQNEHENALEGV